MRKLILLMFLLRAFSFAEELSSDQQMMYMRQCLTVEPLEESRWGMGWGKTNWDWRAFKGFSPISKIEFMRLTGYEKEAKAIEIAERMNRDNQRLAIFAGFIGLGLLTWGALSLDNDNINITTLFLQWGGGTSLLIFSMVGSLTKIQPESEVSLQKAKMIADQYNERLKQDILQGRLKVRP